MLGVWSVLDSEYAIDMWPWSQHIHLDSLLKPPSFKVNVCMSGAYCFLGWLVSELQGSSGRYLPNNRITRTQLLHEQGGIWIQVLMFTQNALYPLSHLPGILPHAFSPKDVASCYHNASEFLFVSNYSFLFLALLYLLLSYLGSPFIPDIVHCWQRTLLTNSVPLIWAQLVL